MSRNLNVGIIGVNADRGWAREAHVPAVRAVAGLELLAVASRDQARADAAAAAAGAARAYGDPHELIADPDIDIVTVATSVPAHRDLIVAALGAGKHVVTEWPVGTCTTQTAEIAEISLRSRGHTAVGLQARMNPAAITARELISSGQIGRVLSATVDSTTAGFGRLVPAEELYLEQPETAMNLPTIQLPHTVDFALGLTGPLTSLSALLTTQYPVLSVGEEGRSYRRVIADHVLLQGRLADGGALSVQVAGGRPADDTPFRMDIVGEEGVLTLRGGAPRGFQSGRLELSVNGIVTPVQAGPGGGLAGPVVNVASVYAALRDDISQHSTTTPNFAHAVRLSHLVDDVLAAAAAGRQTGPTRAWPVT